MRYREIYFYQGNSKTETDLVQFIDGEISAWFVQTDDYERHPDGWRPVAVSDIKVLEPAKHLQAEMYYQQTYQEA